MELHRRTIYCDVKLQTLKLNSPLTASERFHQFRLFFFFFFFIRNECQAWSCSRKFKCTSADIYANVCLYVYAKLIYGLRLKPRMGEKRSHRSTIRSTPSARELNDLDSLRARKRKSIINHSKVFAIWNRQMFHTQLLYECINYGRFCERYSK